MLSRLSKIITNQVEPASIPDHLWKELIELALRENVGPMLWQALKESGFDTEDPMWEPIKFSAVEATAHQMVLEHGAIQLGAALAEENIPAVWLKGFALGRTVYPDPLLRPMVDLDILVPQDKRKAALRLAQSLGYDFPARPDISAGLSDALCLKLAHHDHLVCVRCGKVEEFVNETIEACQNKIADSAGYRITDHSLIIYGICPDCQSRET